MSKQTVFVTGGGGYVASHCIVELLNAGYDVIAVDNFANSLKGTNQHTVHIFCNFLHSRTEYCFKAAFYP